MRTRQSDQSYYDAMQVCLNGHVITERYYDAPEFRQAFCTICGEATTKSCPNCNSDIQGKYNVPGVAILGGWEPVAPVICKDCGKRYPWADQLEERRSSKPSDQLSVDAVLHRVFSNFHRVVKQLRRRHSDRSTLDVQNEYDVQDLLHALLCLYFDDIREEEWNPSYAGKSSRSDFLLKKEKAVIEVKMTRRGLADAKIGEELILDIQKYEGHPDCQRLFYFIYDPEGWIRHPSGLCADLSREKDSQMRVHVIINPA